MMGLTSDDIVQLSFELENTPFAIGANCGIGAPDLVAAIVNMKQALDRQGREAIVVAKANCGVPEYIDGKIVYSGTEEVMSNYMRLAIDSGATIIGGCCGTTPDHVAAMRVALDGHTRSGLPNVESIESQLGEVTAGAKAQMSGDLSIAGGAVSDRGGETPFPPSWEAVTLRVVPIVSKRHPEHCSLSSRA